MSTSTIVTYILKNSTPQSYAWRCTSCLQGTATDRYQTAQPTRQAAVDCSRGHVCRATTQAMMIEAQAQATERGHTLDVFRPEAGRMTAVCGCGIYVYAERDQVGRATWGRGRLRGSGAAWEACNRA